MMEIPPPLICNNLKCRKDLVENAVVTTCNHIFCLECASQNGLASNDTSRRITCPLCDAQLAGAKDVVVSYLDPSEDFKTSVLGGLSPNLIMECARRALNFWVFQTTQNLFYQQHLQRGLTERYVGLSARLDQIVSEANSEIDALHRRIKTLETSQDSLQRKNDELAQAYKDKSRKLLQVQELYDRVKKKAEMSLMQQAASDAIDLSIGAVPRQEASAASATTGAMAAKPDRFGSSQMQNQIIGPLAPLNHASRFNTMGVTDEASHLNAHLYGSRENACMQKGLQIQPLGKTTTVSPMMPFHQGPGGQSLIGPSHHSSGLPDTPGMNSGMESRQHQMNHTPNFSQRRDGLSGSGLFSEMQKSNPANFKGYGAPLRGLY